jgi:predicted ester cyclase
VEQITAALQQVRKDAPAIRVGIGRQDSECRVQFVPVWFETESRGLFRLADSTQREDGTMEQMLDRRNALKMGLLATVGFGALSRVADASTGLQSQNEAVVGRWFTDFWGKTYNPTVVDEIAAPDMLLKYSLHKPRHGREDIKAFMRGFRAAFPDLNFWGTADLIAEGDYVIGQWEGGGTHTGPAFSDFLVGSLPAASGRKMHFTGITILKLKDGKIIEENGLDDGVTALTQLGLLRRT